MFLMHKEEQRWENVLTPSNSPNCSSKGQTSYLVSCEKCMNSCTEHSASFTCGLETVWHGHVQLFVFSLFCLNSSNRINQIHSLNHKGRFTHSHARTTDLTFTFCKVQKNDVAFEIQNCWNYILKACVSQIFEPSTTVTMNVYLI